MIGDWPIRLAPFGLFGKVERQSGFVARPVVPAKKQFRRDPALRRERRGRTAEDIFCNLDCLRIIRIEDVSYGHEEVESSQMAR